MIFTKLVPEITESSIWNEPPEIRVVWITLLAKKDTNGYVRGDVRTIARLANVSEEAAERALTVFQQPDPHSHTQDFEGRRIAPAAGGWQVLNHAKYVEYGMTEVRRENWREQKKRQKLNKIAVSASVPGTFPETSRNPLVLVLGSSSSTGGQGGGVVGTDAPEIPLPSPAAVAALLAHARQKFKLPELDATTATIAANLTELLARGYKPDQITEVMDWATSEKAGHLPGRPQSAASATDPLRFGQWLRTMENHAAKLEDERKRRNR